MSGTLALASAIATLDREALARLVQARKPLAFGAVADPIGLAAELLRPESITRALASLDHATLRVLATCDWQFSPTVNERLKSLGLVGADVSHTAAKHEPAALPEVEAALRAALEAAGIGWEAFVAEADVRTSADTHAASPADYLSASHAASPSQAPANASSQVSAGRAAVWFTPALTTVGEVAECLRALHIDGLRLNRSGTVGVAAARELAERTTVPQAAVSLALRLLGAAGLTVAADHRLVPSAHAAAWLALPHQARWLSLARAQLAMIPGPLRDSIALDTGAPLASPDLGGANAQLPSRFPLLPASDLAAATQFVTDAEHLGCTAQGVLTPVALQLLAGTDVPLSEVTALLPPAATGVYLQPDLTLLAPGPLDPVHEASLAALTRPEQIGPASMRRVTEASLAAAFDRGVSRESAHDTFARLSMTGVPQPLEYLLTSVSERIGRIVVHEHQGLEGRSRIRVAQSALAETALVDRQLQHLQLTRSPVAQGDQFVVLFSRLRPDHVVSAFNEARYHASLAGEAAEPTEPNTPGSPDLPGTTGRVELTGAAGAARQAAAQDPDPDPAEAMIERVYLAARTEPAAAAFTRRLELAIRDKTAVAVTAEARGQRRTFTLTPVALTDGRLRATDVGAGVERTLPVSMIVAVEPA